MSCKCKNHIEVKFFTENDKNGNPIQDLKFAKQGDACVDIRCKEDVKILPLHYAMISTGLYVAIPEGYEMQIRPRSGISAKTFLIFKNTIGTIDAGYRNEIFVLWYNLGNELETFKAGDRIAQAKIEKVLPVIYISTTLEDVKNTGFDRKGGFGSSGLE